MNDLQFIQNFRMSRECFGKLLEFCRSRQCNIYNIELEPLVFFYYISHTSTYSRICEIFGLSHSKAFRMIKETSSFLKAVAFSQKKFPRPEEYSVLKQGFLSFGDIEGCILTIDGTHIQITKPDAANPTDYFNKKVFFAIICMLMQSQT